MAAVGCRWKSGSANNSGREQGQACAGLMKGTGREEGSFGKVAPRCPVLIRGGVCGEQGRTEAGVGSSGLGSGLAGEEGVEGDGEGRGIVQ